MKKADIAARVFVGISSLLLILCSASRVHAGVLQSAPVGTVEAAVLGVEETLGIVIKNVSNDLPAASGKLSFPSGYGVATSTQYLEVNFQSNVIGAAVIIYTDNRRRGAGGTTLANPAFKSGPDGLLGTADDEAFSPQTGASGAGMVGKSAYGHGYVIPVMWTVFDAPRVVNGVRGYQFTGDYAKEAVVTDKAQTHSWGTVNGRVQLVPQRFDSAANIAYASIIVGMRFVNGKSEGLIASFPEDVDGPANGNLNGLRSCTSPVVIYLGVNYTGAVGQQYSTNTMTLELIHQ